MTYAITLIVLGLLAAPSLLLSRKPDAKEWLDKITPYQGWVGVGGFVWGIWQTIQAIMNIGWLSKFPVLWTIWLLSAAVMAALGFLMGYGMIQKYALSGNETAREKGEKLLQKLAPLQGKLGLFGVILGIVGIILNIID